MLKTNTHIPTLSTEEIFKYLVDFNALQFNRLQFKKLQSIRNSKIQLQDSKSPYKVPRLQDYSDYPNYSKYTSSSDF